MTGSWDDLPDAEGWDSLPDAPPPIQASPSILDRLGAGANEFFGRGDPQHPKEFKLLDLGKQALKAGAFLVPGSGLASMAGAGALYGAGASDAEDPIGMAKSAGWGAAGGVVGGKALQGLGQVAGWVARKGAEKVGAASAKAGAKAAEEAAAAVQSAAGKTGGEVQKGSRYVENLMRLEEAMTPEQRVLYAQLQEKGIVPKLQQSVAQSTLEALPGQAASIAARQAEQAAVAEGAPAAAAAATEKALALKTVADRLKEQAWRYGPVLAGGLAGAAGGPAGGLVGLLAGAGSRPMIQALRRTANMPAAQKAIGEAMESVASPVARALTGPSAIEGAAGSKLSPELQAWLEALQRRAGGPALTPAMGEDQR